MTPECTCYVKDTANWDTGYEHFYSVVHCPLHAAAPALLAALETVEWAGISGDDSMCPSCAHFWRSTGHRENCQIRAALKAARGEE